MPVQLRRLVPTGSLALLIALAAVPVAEGASVKRVKTVSSSTSKASFPSEKGAGAAYNASLPRGKFCRGDVGKTSRIWWSETGGQGIPGDGRCRSVPSQVATAADQLDRSRKAGVSLGFTSVRDGSRPVGTSGRWPRGGDSRYDAIVLGSNGPGGESGLNVCPTGQKKQGSRSLTSGTYMRLFTGARTARPQSPTELRATVTHEYFHGLQCRSLGLDRIVRDGNYLAISTPPAQLMEATAEWFSSVVYPQGQVGESFGQTFSLGRGTLLCSVPTTLLATGGDEAVQHPYTVGALLAGAFGPDKAGARSIRDGLRRSRTTAFQTDTAKALRTAFGDAAIATGMTVAIDRSCAARRTIRGDLPVLAGTPSPQRYTRVDLAPGATPQTGTYTVAPLSTTLVLYAAGPPALGQGPAAAFSITASASGPAGLAAYSTGRGGDLGAGFGAGPTVSIPNVNGFAVMVLGNPSLSAPLTVTLTTAAG